ncbi:MULTISPECIES: hypothetical protein [Paraburkholderia]|nr:hypothetical protein [Paraburkholderia fungorum]
MRDFSILKAGRAGLREATQADDEDPLNSKKAEAGMAGFGFSPSWNEATK